MKLADALDGGGGRMSVGASRNLPEHADITQRKIERLAAQAAVIVPHMPNDGMRKHVDRRTPVAPPSVLKA
jgi:hypothetical protein